MPFNVIPDTPLPIICYRCGHPSALRSIWREDQGSRIWNAEIPMSETITFEQASRRATETLRAANVLHLRVRISAWPELATGLHRATPPKRAAPGTPSTPAFNPGVGRAGALPIWQSCPRPRSGPGSRECGPWQRRTLSARGSRSDLRPLDQGVCGQPSGPPRNRPPTRPDDLAALVQDATPFSLRPLGRLREGPHGSRAGASMELRTAGHRRRINGQDR